VHDGPRDDDRLLMDGIREEISFPARCALERNATDDGWRHDKRLVPSHDRLLRAWRRRRFVEMNPASQPSCQRCEHDRTGDFHSVV
jgi:hypothetical protein